MALKIDVKNVSIIAVMGVTGSGKSTFIHKVTGDPAIEIGHRLASCTQEPRLYEFSFGDRKVALLDTPGFDDTFKTDAEVLQGVADFLALTYKSGMKLSGIIYLQRITDPRMSHGGQANLQLFRALCGDDPLRKVVLATTFWGVMNNEERAKEHEEELETDPDYWGDMMKKHARMTRFLDTEESALEIIRDILENEEKITLKIQHEMVDKQRELIDTSAGEIVRRELSGKIEKYEKELADLKDQVEKAKRSHDEELKDANSSAARRTDRMRKQLQDQMDLLKSQNREDLRNREMEFDARMVALAKSQRQQQEIETTKPRANVITPPEEKAESPVTADQPITSEQEDEAKKAIAKQAKKDKILEIFAAVGTTATAAGLAVINPLAIPVAFGGLIQTINACFSRKRPTDDVRRPETYQELAS